MLKALLLSKNLSILFINCIFRILHVVLGPNDDLLHALTRMFIDLCEPGAQVLNALGVGAVIGEDHSISSLIISLRNSSEALLSRCIPHLKFNDHVVDFNLFAFKVYAYGCSVVFDVLAFCKFKHKSSLSNHLIPNQYYTKEFIMRNFLQCVAIHYNNYFK